VASSSAQRCLSHQPHSALLQGSPVIDFQRDPARRLPGCSGEHSSVPSSGFHRPPGWCQQSRWRPGPAQEAGHTPATASSRSRSAACNRAGTDHTGRWEISATALRRGRRRRTPATGRQQRGQARTTARASGSGFGQRGGHPGGGRRRKKIPLAGLHPRRRCAGHDVLARSAAIPKTCQAWSHRAFSLKSDTIGGSTAPFSASSG